VARYSADSRDKVREAVDMVDLVQTRTELRRAGPGRFSGRCPFHEERTPSFSVDADQKLYHCFGCQVGGDPFTFVQEAEGLPFKEALEWLAQRYGVELAVDEEDPREAERRRARERLLELLERAATFYVRYLWESKEATPAREYLAARGLEEASLREFRVGYAPSAWDRLLEVARKEGFSNREIYDAGLARRAKGEGRIYDWFRRRIMFPLCDPRGRVLGFGGRALGADQEPKYVNSPDGEVYTKGRWLFAADIARRPAAHGGRVVLAEGYTDVIALHQAGVKESVGLMGTALTEGQVGELAKLAPTVALALDADSAGQEAMLRAARLMAGRKLELRVVPLPAGSDPADLALAEGPAAVARRVEESVPFVRFRVERELERGDLSSSEGKDRVIEALGPAFATLAPSAMREELVRMVADRTQLQPTLVASWLPAPGEKAVRRPPAANGGGSAQAAAPQRPVASLDTGERAFLAQCVALPDIGEVALAQTDDSTFSSELLRRAAAHLRVHLREPGEALPPEDAELATLVAQLRLGVGAEHASRETLEAERIKLELARVERELAAGGSDDVNALAQRREELRRQMNTAIDRVMEQSAPAEP
jgi:DNA primase